MAWENLFHEIFFAFFAWWAKENVDACWLGKGGCGFWYDAK
jgi:hypothetical protein